MKRKLSSRFSSGEVTGEDAVVEQCEKGKDWARAVTGPPSLELRDMFSDVGKDTATDDNLFGDLQTGLDTLTGSADESDEQQYEPSLGLDPVAGDVNAADVLSRQVCKERNWDEVDLDAVVNSALLSLPIQVPKPIWEEGIWEAIMGDGILMTVQHLFTGVQRPTVLPTIDSWVSQMEDTSLALKRKSDVLVCESYADVVKHLPDRAWQEERESVLQSALKRWLVTVISFDQKSTIWQQLASETSDVGKLTILADVFAGKAPSTLLKRVRAVEKMVGFLGVGCFPPPEPQVYKFFQVEREAAAPASRLKSYLEALAFCMYTFSMPELKAAVESKRLHGATVSAVPSSIVPSCAPHSGRTQQVA